MRVIDAFGDLFFGAECPGCAAPRLGLCENCSDRLNVPPMGDNVDGRWLVWAGSYTGVLRNVILSAKERGALGMIPRLATLLTDAIVTAGNYGPITHPVLVPIPTQLSHIAQRGIDLTRALTERTARQLDGVSVRQALRFTRKPADQSELSQAERRENLIGAFTWRGRPARAPIIIIDDIYTTGATIAEAARACTAAGNTVLGAAVIARA
ncbi:MAG: ComF family protein [Propionibacteriaceae bacterium]|jgi:predicted amidophosphoribosyltransferase|nr:ComF family protein [Propionibacteriaceae bacterium]